MIHQDMLISSPLRIMQKYTGDNMLEGPQSHYFGHFLPFWTHFAVFDYFGASVRGFHLDISTWFNWGSRWYTPGYNLSDSHFPSKNI
jgi:hypothetical protein